MALPQDAPCVRCRCAPPPVADGRLAAGHEDCLRAHMAGWAPKPVPSSVRPIWNHLCRYNPPDKFRLFLDAVTGDSWALVAHRAEGCAWFGEEPTWAAAAGQTETLRVLRALGRDWTGQEYKWALIFGHWDTVLALVDLGCPWSGREAEKAVRYAAPEVLRLLVRSGCPWSGREYAVASEGRRAFLPLLHELRAPWAGDECELAVLRGDEASLRLLAGLGAPWSGRECELAVGLGHPGQVRLLRSLGAPWGGRERAAAKGRLDAEALLGLLDELAAPA